MLTKSQMDMKQKVLSLLSNYTIKDVEFSYNQVTLVLNQGHEIVLESESIGDCESQLVVATYEVKRVATGLVELD
jgi:ribulose bisphosphate carboxylase small subunit